MERQYNQAELEIILRDTIWTLHDEIPNFKEVANGLGIDANLLEYLELEPLIESLMED